MFLVLPVEYSIAFELMKDSIYRYNMEQFFPKPSIVIDGSTQMASVENKDYKLSPKTHVIRSGESLSVIARKYRTTVSELTKINKISVNTTLYPGKKLIVGYNKTPIPKPKPAPILVDSVKMASDITKNLSDTVGLQNKTTQGSETVTKDEGAAKTTYITYKVMAGDTLTSIANHFKTVNVAELRKINQLKEGEVLSVGQSLKIPVR
jgi:LysM repeat protein